MAVNTWTNGNGNNQWSDGGNWSLGHAPDDTEDATFDNTSVADCTVDANVDVSKLDVQGTYTGTIDMNGYTCTAGSGGIGVAGGTVDFGSGNVYTQSGDFIQDGGTVTATSGTWYTYDDDFLVNGGTFNHNNGTVRHEGRGGTTKNAQGFYNLIIYQSVSFNTRTISGTVPVANKLDCRRGLFSSGTIEISGNVDVDSASGSAGRDGTMEFVGTGDQTLDANGQQINTILINKASGTLYVISDMKLQSEETYLWRYLQGTVDIGTDVTIKESSIQDHKIFDDSTTEFENFEFAHGDNNRGFTVSGTIHVTKDFTCTSGAQIDGGTIEVKGNLISTDSAVRGDVQIVLNGTGTQNIDTSGGSGDFPDGTVTINKSSGSVVLSNGAWSLNGSGQDLTVTNGILNLNGNDLTVDDVFTIAGNGTLRLKGDESVSYGSISHSGTTEYYDSGIDAVIDNFGTTLGTLVLGADKTHIFKAGDTYSVDDINGNGTSTTRSILKSDTPGTQWSINMSGTSLLVDNVIVYDSDATPGNEITAIGSIGTYLNNDNWEFGPEEWTVAKDGTPAEFSTWAAALAVLDGAVVGGDITIRAIDQTPQTYEETIEFKNCTVQSGKKVTMLGDFSRSGRTSFHKSTSGYFLTISSGRFHVKGFYFDRTDDIDDTRNAVKISSGVDNVEISHNHLIGNGYYPQYGILLEGQNDNIDIWNNLIKMWGEAAVKDEADEASLVHNIWNNTFIKCQEDLYMTSHVSTEISFWNNIADMDGSYLKECTHFAVIYGAPGVDVNRFKRLDYNLYNFRTSTNMYLYTDNLTGAATYEYIDLAALQAAHPTLETNGIEADPLFDTYCSDYHIADDTSPARDSADESDFPNDDNDGIMRVIPDRGCYDNDIPEELAIGRPQIDKKQNATFWVTLEDLRSSGDDRNVRVELDYVREL